MFSIDNEVKCFYTGKGTEEESFSSLHLGYLLNLLQEVRSKIMTLKFEWDASQVDLHPL